MSNAIKPPLTHTLLPAPTTSHTAAQHHAAASAGKAGNKSVRRGPQSLDEPPSEHASHLDAMEATPSNAHAKPAAGRGAGIPRGLLPQAAQGQAGVAVQGRGKSANQLRLGGSGQAPEGRSKLGSVEQKLAAASRALATADAAVLAKAPLAFASLFNLPVDTIRAFGGGLSA